MTNTNRPHGLTETQATGLVLRLMALPGPSGEEGRVAKFVTRQLLKAGADPRSIGTDQAHRRSPRQGQTGNLVLKLPGTLRAPRRLLVAHMDTVPICVGCRPIRRDQRVVSADSHTGLGADNRAGTAVLLSTALAILRHGLPHPPLTFLWCVQEEIGLQGARLVRLGALGKPQLAFNWDGGCPEKLTIGATGGYRMELTIRGLASHAGGAPEKGISAIAIAALAISSLVQRGWHGKIEKGRHQGTSNVGVIAGGTATNVVAEEVKVQIEARSHDPEFRQRIVTEIERAFQDAAREVQSASSQQNILGQRGHLEWKSRLEYESFRLPLDDPSLQAAKEAIRKTDGTPQLAIADDGLDANWLTARGIPTVSLGCGQKNIHTAQEELDLEEYHRARAIALHIASQVLPASRVVKESP